MAGVLQTAPRKLASQALPELQNGDHLSASEFLRRYHAMPEVKKAELVQGTVYMASPVRIDQHGDPDSLAQVWLGTYAIATPGVKSATNATTKLGPRDVPQPDGLLRYLPENGGQSTVVDGYLVGAPELVFEVSGSSASLDSHAKKEAYLQAGVREYLVWRTQTGEIDWWVREEDDYILLEPDEDGILRSRIFPGLWLDAAAMIAEN